MRGAWKEASIAPRFCETCGEPLKMHLNAAGTPAFRDYMRRRFCSLSCANARRKGGDKYVTHLFHARKMLGPECEGCGTKERLQVHHVDLNPRNNQLENIQTLCVSCHASWHWQLRKSGVSPTPRMPRHGIPWLMGLPPVWDDCAATAMQSMPKRRKSSSRA